MSVVPQPYSQTDLLHGVFTYGYSATFSGLHWAEFSSRLGTTDVMSDPQFQFQPMDQYQPLQLAVNFNLINQTWPRIGPLIVQTALTAGWQWTDGQGNVATFGPQIDLSLKYFDWIHLQGELQLNNTFSGGSLHTTVQVPATMLNATARF
jgi:hypothetical protein